MVSALVAALMAALMGQAGLSAGSRTVADGGGASEGVCAIHVTTFVAFTPGVRDQGPFGGAGDAMVNGLVHGDRKAVYRELLPTVLDHAFQARSIDRAYIDAITDAAGGTAPIVVHDGRSSSAGEVAAPPPGRSCRIDLAIDDISMTSTATWTGIRVKATLRGPETGGRSPYFSRTVVAGLHLFEQKTAADRAEAVEDLQAAFRLALTMIRDKAPAWKARRGR